MVTINFEDFLKISQFVQKNQNFDFKQIGQVIKKARESKGMIRERLAEIIGYAPRHIQAIEGKGQHPSVDLLTSTYFLTRNPSQHLNAVNSTQ